MKYIVIEGDIVNGVEFAGPFETEQAAEDYGERFLVEYIVALVDQPGRGPGPARTYLALEHDDGGGFGRPPFLPCAVQKSKVMGSRGNAQ